MMRCMLSSSYWQRWGALAASVLAGLWGAMAAQAAPLPSNEAERACWLRYTKERTRLNIKEPTQVDFSNLRHGDSLRSPFLVEFAVRGMGVVPAGKVQPGTGHHHVLVDVPLPSQIGEKIPFSDTHKHFGKGQTSAVLDLPAGKHTLRLLFADHDHRPYFVYSREITINVIGPRAGHPSPVLHADDFDANCALWYQDEVSRPRPAGERVLIANLRDAEPVNSPFNLRFGIDGLGVSAASQVVDKTGHFRLVVTQGGRPVKIVDLANGATQTNLGLPNGAYGLRLHFVDSSGSRDLVAPLDQTVLVVAQDKF